MPEQNPHGQPAPSRPHIPATYGVERTSNVGMIPWHHVREQMANSRNYWVVTTRPDGRPHVMPVWGIWLDETFYFSTDPASRKGRNLAANSETVVHLESGDEVVIIEGTTEKVTNATILTQFADAYSTKYRFRPDVNHPAFGVYRLRPPHCLCLVRAGLPTNRYPLDFRQRLTFYRQRRAVQRPGVASGTVIAAACNVSRPLQHGPLLRDDEPTKIQAARTK